MFCEMIENGMTFLKRSTTPQKSNHNHLIRFQTNTIITKATEMTSTEEFLVPLSDVRKLKRSNSRGGSDIDLSHHGEVDTVDYRLQAVCPDRKKKISLWHDISLFHMDPETKAETPYLNFVCEIPKFTRYVVLRCVVDSRRISQLSLNLLIEKSSRSPLVKKETPSSKTQRRGCYVK